MNQREREQAVAAMAGQRILVLGDVMLDEFFWGRAHRIAPEAPVPVVEIERESYALGGAANVAANIRALGGVPFVIGVIGDDPAAEHLRDAMLRWHLEWHGLVTDAARPTTRKTRVMVNAHQMARFDRESRHPIPEPIETAVIAKIDAWLPHVAAVAVSDYDKGVLTPRVLRHTLMAARSQGLPVALDPKPARFAHYQPVTVVTPNLHEAALIAQTPISDDATLSDVCRRLSAMLGDAHVLVTRGEAGMTLYEATGRLRHLPAVAREVYDVTGAGDTVLAVLTLGMSIGLPLHQAAELANRAAGVVVGKLGTATARPEELVAGQVLTVR
ncbi:MAG: D-glycero-beta-D-manno-heptose-7-phosphate kinase [Chloracidobacterium sp.]|nr:D-glycero-beta-D-manno-heptose-7-phosphate kinase [Chloracidobacterium sp.]MDW8218867.1 D-glycero-beta-D-manno-heptose-7-phosphate kinase [Acidobacteriota bacterium]